MSKIAIVNYGVGNVRSIMNAFESVEADTVLTRDYDTIMDSDGLVLPGVGAFAHGMEKLREYNLIDTIIAFSKTNKPILGICLGMQMLLSSSDEFGETKGIDLIPGHVEKLKPENKDYQKLPHISWNGINEQISWTNTILDHVNDDQDMYFVHSFVAVPDDKNHVLSTTTYSDKAFCSSLKKENIYGCQFHPEKSSTEGLKIINNFVNICKVNKDV